MSKLQLPYNNQLKYQVFTYYYPFLTQKYNVMNGTFLNHPCMEKLRQRTEHFNSSTKPHHCMRHFYIVNLYVPKLPVLIQNTFKARYARLPIQSSIDFSLNLQKQKTNTRTIAYWSCFLIFPFAFFYFYFSCTNLLFVCSVCKFPCSLFGNEWKDNLLGVLSQRKLCWDQDGEREWERRRKVKGENGFLSWHYYFSCRCVWWWDESAAIIIMVIVEWVNKRMRKRWAQIDYKHYARDR